MNDAEQTPVDRPIMLSDLNDIRRAVHNAETHTLAMHSEFQSFRDRMRIGVGVCIGCALVSVASAIASVASAAP